ncbi:hypothetical protein OV320_2564 [Actinobacteria bacterium OV320]|nr:hypothetical protein OV320_2564 [Actinobacteria bacterium OV320]
MDIGRKLAEMEARLNRIERSSRLSHAALDNTAITVKDSLGTVRGAIGMQPDGTIGLIAVDGPPPGAPTTPVVTPSIGGLRIVWDGTLADGTALPADFDHVAVHVSTSPGFTPSAATFVGTITRSGTGGMLPVTPLPYVAHYVVLLAVNSSGIAGPPSAETAATPVQVEGPDLTVGSVTAAAIEAGAITAEKLEAILQLVTRIVAGNPAGARVELNEDGLRVYDGSGVLVIQFNSADGSAVFTGDITGSDITGSTITGTTVTGGLLRTATSGERITINESNANKIFIYDSTGSIVTSVTPTGISLAGPAGNVMAISPATTIPSLRWFNSAQTKSARTQASEDGSGNVSLESVTSKFADGGPYSDLIWHHYMGKDQAFIERMRDDGTFTTYIGGSLSLAPGYARLQLNNTDSPTLGSKMSMEPALGYVDNARFQVLAPASSNSAFYVQGVTAHTGYLLRAYRDADMFLVDKDGNTTIAGGLAVATTTWTSWTPAITNGGSATYAIRDGWYYKIGKLVYIEAYITLSALGTGTTGITISLPSTPYRGSANRRQYIGVYLGGIAAGTNSSVGGHGVCLIQPGGSGALLDQVRGPTDIQVRGENLSATATMTINGWYREA